MNEIIFDWETYSECNLKLCGGFAYAAHPSTRPLCAWVETGGEFVFWTPECYPGWQPPDGIQYAWGLPWMFQLFSNPDNVFIGHHADFDKAIAEITLGLPQRTWIDTMAVADTLGFPGGLDGIGALLYEQGKDKKGYRLMMSLCKPNRKGLAPMIRHQDLTALCIYNRRDGEITRRFWRDYGSKLPQVEMDVYFAHTAVNWRGVALDLDFIKGMNGLNLAIGTEAGLAVEKATQGILGSDGRPAGLGREDLTRVEYLQEWFNDQGRLYGGWSIDSCDEDTLDTMLAQTDALVPPHIKAVIHARLAVAGAAVAKLRAMMNRVSPDGRLRGEYRYHGALTGRWKSLGVQIHNLARPHPMFMSDANEPKFRDGTPNRWHSEAIIDAIREVAVAGDLGRFRDLAQHIENWRREHIDQLGIRLPVTIPHCFKSVVRSMFVPSPGKVFVGADYSSIEGRGAAWLAHDEPILDAYRAYDAKRGPDLYCVMASTIFGRSITKKDTIERQVGKVAELGCTYQMGAEKLQNTDNNAAELAAAGVTAQQVVEAWRTKHRMTARYWRELDKALKFAITDTRGRSHWANSIEFSYNYGLLEIRLPVGRSLWYHNPLLRPSPRFEGATEVIYENYRKGEGEYATMTLHGGKVLENINQGICRDLLAAKLVQCENANVDVVMHTHDEVNAECDRADAPDVARWLEERMGETPAWAEGFPVKGEPGIMERYGK